MDKDFVLTIWQGEQLASRIDLERMLAANQEREHRGESLAYDEKTFSELRDDVCANNDRRIILLRG